MVVPNLTDDMKCFETLGTLAVRSGRVLGVHCGSVAIANHGRDTRRAEGQNTPPGICWRCLDDLSGTVLAGYNQPLVSRLLYLAFGSILAKRWIGHELEPNNCGASSMPVQLGDSFEVTQTPLLIVGFGRRVAREGIACESLQSELRLYQFVHDVRGRGTTLLEVTLSILLV